MVNYILFGTFSILLVSNGIMMLTDGKSELSRFLRLHLYDITPAMYITLAMLVWFIGLVSGDINSGQIFAAQAVLLLSCLIAYAGRYLSRKSVRKKARKLVPMTPLENTLKKAPKCKLAKKAKKLEPHTDS